PGLRDALPLGTERRRRRLRSRPARVSRDDRARVRGQRGPRGARAGPSRARRARAEDPPPALLRGPDAVADRAAGRDLADARLTPHPALAREDARRDRDRGRASARLREPPVALRRIGRRRTSAELGEGFLSYFESKGHKRLPSWPLVPRPEDASTLLTSAGMQPQMPYFLGREDPPAVLTTTAQKCFRTPDIDEVGLDGHHLTFFEMLGNFSFGQYFKQGA